MTPVETVLEFVDGINHQHIEKMVGLMTPDHQFTDSLGKQIPGRRHMRDAWQGYFKIIPDYHVEVQATLDRGDSVVIIGSAAGTFTSDGTLRVDEHWCVPAAWRAVVQNSRIAEWHAYVDNEPLRQAMRRAGISRTD